MEINSVTVHAPARVCIGGMLDHPAAKLLFSKECVTVNCAIDLYSTVTIETLPSVPSSGGPVSVRAVKIFSGDKMDAFEVPESIVFRGWSACYWAILRYFDVSGVRVTIASPSQVLLNSGLGVGGSILVALALGCSVFSRCHFSKRDLVELVWEIETFIGNSVCGRQDQCAALYGGMNGWFWQREGMFRRGNLNVASRWFVERLVIAYIGGRKSSSVANIIQQQAMLSGRHYQDYDLLAASNISLVQLLGQIHDSVNPWEKIARCVALSRDLTLKADSEKVHNDAIPLWDVAKKLGAEFHVAGAGRGGCVWALAPNWAIRSEVEKTWSSIVGARNVFTVGVGKGAWYELA